MYVLQLDAKERKYLLSLLKTQRDSAARRITAELSEGVDAFGVVWWTNADIASALSEQALADTTKNVHEVRELREVRNIGARMVEHGWSVLEDGVLQLKHALPQLNVRSPNQQNNN